MMGNPSSWEMSIIAKGGWYARRRISPDHTCHVEAHRNTVTGDYHTSVTVLRFDFEGMLVDQEKYDIEWV